MSTDELAVDGADTQVAPVETAEAVVAEPAQQTTTEETVEAKAERTRDEQGRFQSRINEITARAGRAERERDAMAARIQQFEQAQQRAQVQADNKPPSFEDFPDLNQWAAAVADHASRVADQQAERRFAERHQQTQQEQVFGSYEVKEREYAAKNPEYTEALHTLQSSVRFPNAVLEVIATSEFGPGIVHHLGTHLDVADRIQRLPPHLAAAEIARIEARISAPKSKPVSNAPSPPPALGGGSAIQKDPERMSTDEWLAWRRDQLKAK